jgi:ribokinase
MTDEPTGCAFFTVDEAGENAIMGATGANVALCSQNLPFSLLVKASVVVLQMEVRLPDSLDVVARARQAGVKVIWNFPRFRPSKSVPAWPKSWGQPISSSSTRTRSLARYSPS